MSLLSPLGGKGLKFANIWKIEWDGINEIKFGTVQIHFLSDVFVAIAIVVAL